MPRVGGAQADGGDLGDGVVDAGREDLVRVLHSAASQAVGRRLAGEAADLTLELATARARGRGELDDPKELIAQAFLDERIKARALAQARGVGRRREG